MIKKQDVENFLAFLEQAPEEQIRQIKEDCANMDQTIEELTTKLQQLENLKNRRQKSGESNPKANSPSIILEPAVPVSEKHEHSSQAIPYLDQIDHIIKTSGYDFEQIVQILPAKDSLDFYAIMNEIILEFQKQYSFYITYCLETRSSKTERFAQEDLQNIANLEDLRDMLIDYRDDQKEIEQKSNCDLSLSTMLPLLSQNGNNLLIGDLKLFSQEQFPYILKLLQELERGDLRHSKQLSNNSDLKGYCELRNLYHYIRILYKSLGNQQYAILGLFYKNSDNIMGLLNSMKQRTSLFETQKNNIEELIQKQDSTYITLMSEEWHQLKKQLGEEVTYEGKPNTKRKKI